MPSGCPPPPWKRWASRWHREHFMPSLSDDPGLDSSDRCRELSLRDLRGQGTVRKPPGVKRLAAQVVHV